MKKLWLILISGVLVIFYLSCAAPSEPAKLSPPEVLPAKPSRESWEQEWGKIMAASKKEGSVVIYGTAGAGTRAALTPLFKNKFGMEIDFVMGMTGEIEERLLREHKNGLYLVDIFLSNPSAAVTILKPAGVLEYLEPTLLLPEVLDTKLWWQSKLPWVDKDKTMLALFAFPSPAFVVNTNLAQVEEFKSWLDLLNPKWKGKISIQDPTKLGSGWSWFSTVGGKIMGYDFMRALAKQEPVVLRDWRQHVEWVAQGKQAIAIAPKSDTVAEFIGAGAPLKYGMPKEGVGLTTGSGGLALVKKAPHPAASRLFINWLLSREGILAFSKVQISQSARLDVDTDFIPDEKKRRADINYIWQDEEHYLQIPEHLRIAKEIFGHLVR